MFIYLSSIFFINFFFRYFIPRACNDEKRPFICQTISRDQEPDNICPHGYEFYKGKCLQFIKKSSTYEEANVSGLKRDASIMIVFASSPFQIGCGNLGGILYAPKTESEFHFFQAYAKLTSETKIVLVFRLAFALNALFSQE